MKAHLIAFFSLCLAAPAPDGHEPPAVVPNDNRVPAGNLRNDTLVLNLTLDFATWRPEGPRGPSIIVPAFAEEAKPPRIPAPLIRVPAGTVIRAAVRNALDSAVVLRGFFTRPGSVADTVTLLPGATRLLVFPAGAPGTYMYAATPAGYIPTPLVPRNLEREQASGAFVVDPPGGSPPDRVLVINIWGERTGPATYRNALTINGLSWPETERMDATTGDTIRWRIVNASVRAHPMHMHGFYFTVEARGDAGADTVYADDDRRLAVTEAMLGFSTMLMSWAPDRPGNWLFHCHLAFHVVPSARLDASHDAHDRSSHRAENHMAGLVVGMRVAPRRGYTDPLRENPRRLRLFAQEGKRRGHSPRALGYVLQRDDRLPAADSVEIPGSLLVFEQGEPVDLVVANRLTEPVAVHWHGLELESWSDGVAGWSGSESRLAPAVAAGDSFIARITVPRAGTFIYHTHMNDVEQLTSGLYGAIVVVGPGQPFDPATDHVMVIGWDGAAEDGPPRILVNGDSLPASLLLAAGIPHRLRFVNIGAAGAQSIRLQRDSATVEWRRLARDGADLPPRQRVTAPARHVISVGQTADFEVRLDPGTYRLSYALPGPVPPIVQAVIVR